MFAQPGNLILGIDGGGSHTRAAIVDGYGRLCGFGTAGPSNYQAVGIGVAAQNVAAAVAGAWAQAGGAVGPADAAFLGMAGVVSDDDRHALGEVARLLNLAKRVGIDHDIRIALAGGLAGAPGIALIAGTGSSCYGRRGDGTAWRSGGWGHLVDDAGGGYWLGLQALTAITRAYDGRAEATSLAAPIMERLAISNMDAVLQLTCDNDGAKSEIAALAPLVLRTAVYGDRVARGIVARGADELARMVEAVMLRLAWDGTAPVILSGGLTTDTYYHESIRRALERRAPAAELTQPALPPVFGATLLAMELAETPAGDDTIAELKRSASSVTESLR
jgi:glucosamine kinase